MNFIPQKILDIFKTNEITEVQLHIGAAEHYKMVTGADFDLFTYRAALADMLIAAGFKLTTKVYHISKTIEILPTYEIIQEIHPMGDQIFRQRIPNDSH